jgi:hypothetical protein
MHVSSSSYDMRRRIHANSCSCLAEVALDLPPNSCSRLAQSLHFLKVDVQGMEAHVIQGASATLKRCLFMLCHRIMCASIAPLLFLCICACARVREGERGKKKKNRRGRERGESERERERQSERERERERPTIAHTHATRRCRPAVYVEVENKASLGTIHELLRRADSRYSCYHHSPQVVCVRLRPQHCAHSPTQSYGVKSN